MKRHLALATFGLFSFASFTVLAAGTKSAAKSAKAAPDHRRFQQFCDDLSNVNTPTTSLRDYNSRLKQLGTDGWELSGVTGTVACYKRELVKGLSAEPMAWLPAQSPAPSASRPPIKLEDETTAPVAASAPVKAPITKTDAKPAEAKPVAVAKPVDAKPAEAPAADKSAVALAAPAKPVVKINKATTASTTVPASAKTPAKPKTQTATAAPSDDDSSPAPAPGVRRALVPKS